MKTLTNNAVQIIRWSVVAAFDSLFELAITILSVILVLPLQMTREIKISVVFAFSFRIVYGTFCQYYRNELIEGTTVSPSSQSSTFTTSRNGRVPPIQASQPSTPSSGNKSSSDMLSWPPQSPHYDPSSEVTKRPWAGNHPTTLRTPTTPTLTRPIVSAPCRSRNMKRTVNMRCNDNPHSRVIHFDRIAGITRPKFTALCLEMARIHRRGRRVIVAVIVRRL